MCRACGSIHSGLETAATPSNQSFFLEWGSVAAREAVIKV